MAEVHHSILLAAALDHINDCHRALCIPVLDSLQDILPQTPGIMARSSALSSAASLLSLPTEVHERIASCCTGSDLVRLSRVLPSLRSISHVLWDVGHALDLSVDRLWPCMDLDDIPRVAFLPIMKLSKWIDRHQGSVHFADLDSDSDMLNTYSSFLPKLVLVTFEDSQDPERFLEQINSDICISLHLDCYCTPRSYDWSPFVAELQNHDSQVKALTFGNCVPKTIASALPTLSIKELEVHHPRWDWIDLSQLHTFKSLEKLFFYLDYHQSGYVHYFDSTSITNLANCLVKGSLLEVWFRVETGSILFGALVNLPYSTDFPVISHQLCGDKYVVWKIRH